MMGDPGGIPPSPYHPVSPDPSIPPTYAPSPQDMLSPATPEYSLPSPPWLYAVAIVKVLWFMFLLVLIPYQVFTVLLVNAPINFPVPLSVIVVSGALIAILAGARHVSKPTRLYGPISLASSVVKLGYLFILATAGVTSILANSSNNSFSMSFGYSSFVFLLMIGTGLAAASFVVTAVEDWKHPGERLPFDFPLKRRKA